MRNVEEIQKEIALYEDTVNHYKKLSPKYEDYRGYQYAVTNLKSLEAELRAAIVADIPLSDLSTLCDAWREGRHVVLSDELKLSMLAGAYAIENGKRFEMATIINGAHSGNPQKISFYDAAQNLRKVALQEKGANDELR